jgi:crotonobetainyl-CoA:carnitine CoA-transferase CaiB-like acyl-CoA transferase
MDRLGVGWEVLHRINPRLVYASGSGYGLTGPDRDNLAMDLTIQAMSGLIAATGFPGGPPVKAGPAVVDFISGIHLYAATLTAHAFTYRQRQVGGAGAGRVNYRRGRVRGRHRFQQPFLERQKSLFRDSQSVAPGALPNRR